LRIFRKSVEKVPVALQSDKNKSAYTHTGFLPESDPAPVVEFYTRTGIVAAGGQFDFERCTRKMFVHRNGKHSEVNTV